MVMRLLLKFFQKLSDDWKLIRYSDYDLATFSGKSASLPEIVELFPVFFFPNILLMWLTGKFCPGN